MTLSKLIPTLICREQSVIKSTEFSEETLITWTKGSQQLCIRTLESRQIVDYLSGQRMDGELKEVKEKVKRGNQPASEDVPVA